MTYEELILRQSWSLHQKIDHAVGVIESFLVHTDNKAYISFSGGKDSTVMLDIARRFVKKDIPAVFGSTGNEFPEVVRFVKTFDNIIIIRPKMGVKEVIEKYGFPLISKEQSQHIRECRQTKSEKLRNKRLNGDINKNGRVIGKVSDMWKFLIDAPFEVSEQCCSKLRKAPFKIFEKETGLYPIIGTMAEESSIRLQKWLKQGCNSFESGRIGSYPISIFTEKDIWEYGKEFNIPFCSIYGKGMRRTGCMVCGFGCHLEPEGYSRFDVLYNLRPKLYEVVMSYSNSGVTYREALEYIGIKLPDSKDRQLSLFKMQDFYDEK